VSGALATVHENPGEIVSQSLKDTSSSRNPREYHDGF
jgi:hypothetical protein